MAAQSVCPFCGQPLVKREAVDHLRREQAAFERRLREQAEREVETRLRAKLAAEIRRQLEQEYKRKQRAESQKEVEQLRVAVEDLKRQRRIQSRENQRLREQLERARRRAERLEASERGELSEEDLLKALQDAFRKDAIERVGRGKAGADIVHVVRDRVDGELTEAGTIVYESKDTLDWSEGFIAQAKASRERYKTPHVIVVSRAFPRNEKDLCWRDGVPVVHPARAVALAHVIRKFIVEAHRAGLSGKDIDRKTEELYEYIRGEGFRRTLSDIIDISRRLSDVLEAERRQHKKLWNRRQEAYSDLEARATEIDESIRQIIERTASKRGRTITHRPRAEVRAQ